MAGFSEASIVQQPILELLVQAGWRHIPGHQLARSTHEVLLRPELDRALIALNPAIAEDHSRSDRVVSALQNVILESDKTLMERNQRFLAWIRGLNTRQYEPQGKFEPVNLIDFENPAGNSFIVSDEVTFGTPKKSSRFDLVLWVNGIPLVIIETKTRLDARITWLNAARDIHDIYEKQHPEFFVPNAFSVATDGREFRYGSIGLPIDMWNVWGSTEDDAQLSGWPRVKRSTELLLDLAMVLSVVSEFTVFEKVKTPSGHTRLQKIIPRYPQVEAVNAIHRRALHEEKRQGLIHHTQGSGKTIAMLFAAMKLVNEPRLKNPTIVAIADRIQLVTQMTNQFKRAGVGDAVAPEDASTLRSILAADRRGVVFSTVHKFKNAGLLSDRDNIIVLVDEAHRTQEGSLGEHLRAAFPNARFFGFTGTAIADQDRNTFTLFGDPDDPGFAMNTYNSDRSIADGTTVPIHVAPRLVDFQIRKEELDQAFDELAKQESLSDDDKNFLASQATATRTFFANPERVEKIVADIIDHFYSTVDPLGMKAQLVVFDRGLCVQYHRELARQLALRPGEPKDEAAVVMSVAPKDDPEWADFRLTDDQEERLLDRFKAFGTPLKFLIVTSKLGTGFDAPIEGVMYLDKPMKLHTLFQTITRTNRTWRNPDTGQEKLHGLVVDYVGLGDGFARAMSPANPEAARKELDEDTMVDRFEDELRTTLVRFVGIDRKDPSFQAFSDAQDRLPNEAEQAAFMLQFKMLQGIWESVHPHVRLEKHAYDYKWLAKIYMSLEPTDSHNLLWAKLGAKTMSLVHDHIGDVTVVRPGVDLVIADKDTIEQLIATGVIKPEEGKGETITISPEEVIDNIANRLKRRLAGDNGSHPAYKSIADRLDHLREQHLAKAKEGVELLQSFLELAKDLTATEKAEDANGAAGLNILPDPNIGALTQIFAEFKPEGTPVVLDKVVAEIDEVVRQVSTGWDGWAKTKAGDRQVRDSIRRVLNKFALPLQGDLFDHAYAYVAENY